jgi:hypothetical protein
VVGAALLGLGVLLVVLLHLVPPSSRVSPLTRTISEYALGPNRWMFDLGVVALALGSVAVLTTLVRGRVLRPAGTATVLILLWVLGLLTLVAFQKYNYQVDGGIGPGGAVHRLASLVAFLSLPSGGLLAARAGVRLPRWRRAAVITRWACLLACGCLGLLAYAVGESLVTGVHWWRVFPLGLLERIIAVAEIVALFTLARWAVLVGRVAEAAARARSARPGGDRRGGAPLVQ